MTQAVFSGPRWGETPLVKSLNGGDLSQLHILAAISFGCTAFAILHEERAITHQSLLSSTLPFGRRHERVTRACGTVLSPL